MKKINIIGLLLMIFLIPSLSRAKCTGCGCMVDVSKFLACEEQEEEPAFFEERHVFICDWEDVPMDQDKFITLILNHEEMILVPLEIMSKEDKSLKISILNKGK